MLYVRVRVCICVCFCEYLSTTLSLTSSIVIYCLAESLCRKIGPCRPMSTLPAVSSSNSGWRHARWRLSCHLSYLNHPIKVTRVRLSRRREGRSGPVGWLVHWLAGCAAIDDRPLEL